jgi:hypothetical protein
MGNCIEALALVAKTSGIDVPNDLKRSKSTKSSPSCQPALEALRMLTDACCAVATARHFSVRKLRRALRRLVRSAPFHELSLLSFGLLFVRQRVGGGAPVAELAERLGAGVAAGRRSTLAFDELVVRRVFGGRGVDAMARSMRAAMIRMLQTRPVCALAVNLQVMGGGGGGCRGLQLLFGMVIALLVFAGGGESAPHWRKGTAW